MVMIEPLSLWHNGQMKTASIMAMHINDNAKDTALVYYRLMDDKLLTLAEGNLTMMGEDYNGWETNEYAYDWVSGKLGLSVLGLYIPSTNIVPTAPPPIV